MKTRILIITILSIAAIELCAQTFGRTYTPAARDYQAIPSQLAMHSQQIMTTGNAYNGTVYEPFSSAMPSELSEVGSENSSEGNKPGKHIRTFIKPGETGQAEEYPIGDAWVLLLCAAVYGVWTVYRRRKRKA